MSKSQKHHAYISSATSSSYNDIAGRRAIVMDLKLQSSIKPLSIARGTIIEEGRQQETGLEPRGS